MRLEVQTQPTFPLWAWLDPRGHNDYVRALPATSKHLQGLGQVVWSGPRLLSSPVGTCPSYVQLPQAG